MFAKIENNQITALVPTPDWRNDDGSPVTDPQVFIANGLYPITGEPPAFDTLRQTASLAPWDQWLISADQVERQYVVTDKPLAEVQQELIAQLVPATLFPWDFGGSTGIQHLQVRDADDRTNWLVLQVSAQAMIAAGHEDAQVTPIRTAENSIQPITATQAAHITAAMIQWGAAQMQQLWVKKDAILNAASVDDAIAAFNSAT